MNRLFIISSKINLSEIEKIGKKKIEVIINLTKSSTVFHHKLLEKKLSEYDFYQSVSTKSIKDYISFISQISDIKLKNNKTIREFKVDNLPIYWLTPLSEKHPYNHWLFNLFLLRNFLDKENLTTHQNLIYLPKELVYLTEFLNYFFKKNNLKIIYKSANSVKPTNDRFLFIKNNLVLIFRLLFIRSHTKNIASSKNIFLTSGDNHSYIKKVFSILEPNNSLSIKMLSLKGLYENSSVSKEFYDSKPNFRQLLSVFFTLCKIKLRLKSLKGLIKIDGININTNIILKEINALLIFQPHYFYRYIWLKKYFSLKKEAVNFFYEDEFYQIGRVISAAKKNAHNPNVKTYGVQHGMFSDFHTVYNLTNKELLETEIGKNDELPIPDYFITWGTYFSTQFLKNNTVLKDRIKEIGNPLYLFNTETHHEKSKEYNILYCLTSEALFYKELPIVTRILSQHPKSIITLRNHPNFKFNINPNLFSTTVNISNKEEIKKDLKMANLVLASAHSTIFLDALAYDIPVIRLKTEIHDESMDIITSNCITLSDKIKYSPNTKKKNSTNLFLHMDPNEWTKLLS